MKHVNVKPQIELVSSGEVASVSGRSDFVRMNKPRKVLLKTTYSMGHTPTTQLQYALVMGNSPSRFNKDGVEIVIDGKRILVDPSRPVEYVSHDDAVEFHRRMSLLDPKYDWDLPTESRWEAAVREGSRDPKDAYWFGNNSNELCMRGVEPQGPATGPYRVLRGGSWFNLDSYARSAKRGSDRAYDRSCTYGFRSVRIPK